MIVNNDIIPDRYRCGKKIMRYLISMGVPVLSYDTQYYYFANTELLKTSLKAMPLHLKILAGLTSEKGG